MKRAMNFAGATRGLTLALAFGRPAPAAAGGRIVVAQAMVPPTGMMDAKQPTPMERRYLARYPQPVTVGDLIGLPLLDLRSSTTIGYVGEVVRTPQGKIDLIVSYSRWWGWFGRPIAVPLEVVGIEGRQLVSLDMHAAAYESAPTWRAGNVAVLPADATIKIALARS